VILIFSLFAISWKANFDMDTDFEVVKAARTAAEKIKEQTPLHQEEVL
jgi:hypothetical protein